MIRQLIFRHYISALKHRRPMSSGGGESKSNANGNAKTKSKKDSKAKKNSTVHSENENVDFGIFSNEQIWTRKKLVQAAKGNKLKQYDDKVTGISKSVRIRRALYRQFRAENKRKQEKSRNKQLEKLLKQRMKEIELDPGRLQSDNGEDSAILTACQLNKIEIVKKLIRKGAYIDIQNKVGVTPLYIAAQKGYQQLVSYLISEGADITKKALNGKNAINAAKDNGHVVIAQLIRDAGAKSVKTDTIKNTEKYICKLKF